MTRRLLLGALVLFPSSAWADSPRWTDWEKANSVAQEGEFVVVRQPGEGFCYVKQGYDGYRDKMDLSIQKDGLPYLTAPFYQEGDVSYRVDAGAWRIVPEEEEVSGLGIRLSPEVVPEMKRGATLVVRVKPKGRQTLEQRFGLKGFSAAMKWLGSATCKKKVPDMHSDF